MWKMLFLFVWTAGMTLACAAGLSAPLRPPAMPLNTHDPYFGIRSPADKLPGLSKLMDTPLRDISIYRGLDGTWYLIGTVDPFWGFNEGIKLGSPPTSQTRRHWVSFGKIARNRHLCIRLTGFLSI
jgi:hypothetical protein